MKGMGAEVNGKGGSRTHGVNGVALQMRICKA